MSGSIIGNLADQIRADAKSREGVRIPDLRWAEAIIFRVEAGESMPIYSINLAKQALAEDAHRRNPLGLKP